MVKNIGAGNGKGPKKNSSIDDGVLVEVPAPWALSSYFSGEMSLDAGTRKSVEQYLDAAPQVRRAYLDMKNKDVQRAAKIRKAIAAMAL